MFFHLFTLQKYANNSGFQKVFPYIGRENPYVASLFVGCKLFSLMKIMYLCILYNKERAQALHPNLENNNR